jgi:hypothetical protein
VTRSGRPTGEPWPIHRPSALRENSSSRDNERGANQAGAFVERRAGDAQLARGQRQRACVDRLADVRQQQVAGGGDASTVQLRPPDVPLSACQARARPKVLSRNSVCTVYRWAHAHQMG